MAHFPAPVAALYPEARIVTQVSRSDRGIVVALEIEGLPLDRPTAYTWELAPTDGKLAARLVEAVKDGHVYSLEKISTDAFGKTYPVGSCVMGRHLHRELVRLGY